MILSGTTIRALCIVAPFSERTLRAGMSYGVGPAGYDVRVAEPIALAPGEFRLYSVVEHLTMPNDVIGVIHYKSTLIRLGIALQNSVIEPGWRGHLTVEVSNHGRRFFELPPGSPIAQIVFHRTDRECEPYNGKYNGQGPAPVEAIFE